MLVPHEQDAPPGYVRLLKQCWDQEPTKRPMFDEVVKAIEDISATVAYAARGKGAPSGQAEDAASPNFATATATAVDAEDAPQGQ